MEQKEQCVDAGGSPNEDARTEALAYLCSSPQRIRLDRELRNIISDHAPCGALAQNSLYHLQLDNGVGPRTLEHTKRLRGHLCLLLAEENGVRATQALPGALMVELIHSATLAVDDIQDGDDLRSGRLALWKKTSTADAMNVAFFFVSLGQANYHAKTQSTGTVELSQDIVCRLSLLLNGQQRDLGIDADETLSLRDYEEMVTGKTGALLELACVLGVSVRERKISEMEREALKSFAGSLAAVHQAQDDLDDLGSILEGNESTGMLPHASIGRCVPGVPCEIREWTWDERTRTQKFIEDYLRKKRCALTLSVDALESLGLVRSLRLRTIATALATRNMEGH